MAPRRNLQAQPLHQQPLQASQQAVKRRREEEEEDDPHVYTVRGRKDEGGEKVRFRVTFKEGNQRLSDRFSQRPEESDEEIEREGKEGRTLSARFGEVKEEDKKEESPEPQREREEE